MKLFAPAALAAAMFAVAPAVTLADAHAEAEQNEAAHFETQTFMVEGGGGLPIAVTTGGNPDGPPVLLVHSLMGSTMNWEKQFSSSLAQTHRLISIDTRGHGSSAKPMIASAYTSSLLHAEDIAAVLQATGAEKPTIIAWAYGGLNVMDYVRHFGTNNVGGIVLVEANGGFELLPELPETEEYRRRIARSQSKNLAEIRDWTWEFGDYLMRAGELPQDEAEIIRTSSMMVPHWVRAAMRDRPDDNRDLAESLNVPVLFVVTQREGSGIEMIQRIVPKLPDAEIAIIPTGGSLSFWYEPEKFAEVIQEFSAQ